MFFSYKLPDSVFHNKRNIVTNGKGIYPVLMVLALSIAQKSSGQSPIRPNGQTAPVVAVPAPMPASYSSPSPMFLRTFIPNYGVTDPMIVSKSSNGIQQVQQTTVYLDGWGRPIEEVQKGKSSSGNDLVKIRTYDQYQREKYAYLPYVETGSADGSFKAQSYNSQAAFYKNASLNPGIAADSIFYGQVKFEDSPLKRKWKTFSPGASWAAEGGNHPIEQQYLANTSANAVRVWSVPSAGGLPVSTSAYSPGTLTRTVIIDENGARTEEFRDKRDLVILKKTQVQGNTSNHDGWLCTYYVYDDLSNLVAILPPAAVEAVKSSWQMQDTIYKGLCYAYTYDSRQRMVTKRIPGQPIQEFVYDVRNRMVYSRDGLLRSQGKWMITYYDDMNRPIEKAIYTGSESQSTLQTQLTTGAILNPNLPASSLQPLSYIYYDNYSYTGAKSAVTAEFTKPQLNGNFYPESIQTTSKLLGKITGTKTLILGTSQWLITTMYYDDKGRLIQSLSDNINGGQANVTNLYDYSGKVLSSYLHETDPSSTLMPDIRVLTMTHYNVLGLVDSVSKILNDDVRTRRRVATYYYDELSSLQKLIIGDLESQQYEYNIRGWISSINKDYANGGNNVQNHFGESLFYDRGISKSQFNGNVAGEIWRGGSDKDIRTYGFDYDKANRLTKADFAQQVSSGTWSQANIDFSVSNIAYDPNGNILTMKQIGMKGNKPATIDSLFYKYLPNTNKLQLVTDSTNDPSSVLGDFKETADNKTKNKSGVADYSYDANSNVVSDGNKNITLITYNVLNLPEQISIKGKGVIKYIYSADGIKLRKTTIDSTSLPVKTTVIDYLNGMVYKNDTLQYVTHETGRIRAIAPTGSPVRYVYDYFITDHLGNIRQVLTEKRDTTSYIATMEMASSSKENALFSNIDATRASIPSGFVSDGLTNPDSYVAALNAATGKKIGPSLVLRVMAGDTIQAGVSAFYKSGGDPVTRNNFGTQMLAALLQVFSAGVTADGPHTGTGTNSPIAVSMDTAMYNNLVKSGAGWATNPKAYLNYAFFDDQFTLQSSVSGVKQLPTSPNASISLSSGVIVVPKTGFAYIYVSNESGQEVDFNNLTVVHKTGPLLQEEHYYPFGLTMAGISSSAIKGSIYPENQLKYNSKELQSAEFSDQSGLELYDFGARNYDPQLGRWIATDPLAEKFVWQSPYVAMDNNPMLKNDPTGRSAEVTIDKDKKTLTVSSTIIIYGDKGNEELAQKVASDIQNAWNAAHGTATIDGIKYDVTFSVTGSYRSDITADEIKGNTDFKNNYYRVLDNDGTGSSTNGSLGAPGGNTGRFQFDDIAQGGSTVAAHEYGHGLGAVKSEDGADVTGHPGNDFRKKSGPPGIMYARGTLADAPYTMDPSKGDSYWSILSGNAVNPMNENCRTVNQADINYLHLEKVKFNKDGVGQLGALTNLPLRLK